MARHTVRLLIPSPGSSTAPRPALAGMLVQGNGRVMFQAVDARLARARLTAVSAIELPRERIAF
ncbi:MAG: hypothetical protein R3E72_10585 [Steroidobacteraceae bacterium]